MHDTIAYVIRSGSRTIYSYRLDGDVWNVHSECPRIDAGLVIINDLLTAVGGKVGERPTNKLYTWERTKWVATFPPMHTPRESPAVVHYGDYVIAMGGDRDKRGVELLHIPSLLWSTVTSLPTRLTSITATLCNNDIVTMDYFGNAYTITVQSLISAVQFEGSSTNYSQWTSLPECPVDWPTLSYLSGQPLVVSRNGIFQLLERQWVRIGDMPVPMYYCIVCVVCDQMVVVGGNTTGYSTSTDAVRVAIIA